MFFRVTAPTLNPTKVRHQECSADVPSGGPFLTPKALYTYIDNRICPSLWDWTGCPDRGRKMSRSSAEFVGSLFADSGDDLRRYVASRLPNCEDARDLAQETYLRLLRHNQAELVRHPEAYLFRIAANLIHEHWLKAKLEQESVADSVDPEALASREASGEALAGQQQSLDALCRMLRVLPSIQQRVVLLHRRDGLTYAEIAEELKISPDMVKKYLSKALARCREQLQRYYDG